MSERNKNNNKKDFWKHIKLLIGIFVLTIVFVPIIAPIFDAQTKTPEEYVKQEYDFQLHASQYAKFYEKNADKIIKIGNPYSSEGNNLLKLVLNTKDTEKIFYGDKEDDFFEVKNNAEIKTLIVFKNVNEKWEQFELPIPAEKSGAGFFNEDYKKETTISAASKIGGLVYVLFLGLFIWFIVRSVNGAGFGGLGEIKPDEVLKIKKKLKEWQSAFDLIGGIEAQKAELRQIVEDINNWDKFEEAGVRNLRGMLFFGPPGVGKTMIARAIAIDANIEFFSVNASSLRSSFVGQSAKNVKRTIDMVKKFTQKHRNKLGILFIDEIDTLLQSRKKQSFHGEDASVVNTFLSEMDSIEGTSNVIIIGATNFLPQELDEAAMSRFDKKIFFNLPTLTERIDIITKIVDNYHQKEGFKILDKKNFSIENFARKMPGGSGRDIETIINESVRKAISKSVLVTDRIIHGEIANLVLGPENKSLIIPEDRFALIAYHELGHAYIGKWNGKIAETVTMIPRGPTLGTTWLLEKDDNVLKSKEELINEIQGLCAGRIAENVFCNTETTGASNDYERIKKIAMDYFLVYNFDYNGYRPYTLEKKVENIPASILEELHEKTAQLISDQEAEVKKVLVMHTEAVQKSFKLLIEKETIGHDEIYIQPKV